MSGQERRLAATMRDLGYPVYDADNHLYEAEDAFTRHLDPKLHKEFQLIEIGGRKKLMICGRVSDYIPNPTFEVVAPPGAYHRPNPEGKPVRELFQPERCRVEYRDPERRLARMDEQGVHATLLHPTLGSVIENRMGHDADLLHSVLRAFNQWLDEDWGLHYRDRIFAVPMMSLMDVERACSELERCLERGARAVGLRPAPVPGYKCSRSPGAREFDPFWARVAESGITVVIHSSDSGYDRYAADWDEGGEYLPFQQSPFRAVIMADRPIFDMLAALIIHGAFWRHPGVRVAVVENGSGWVRPLLSRCERAYRRAKSSFAESPTETFRRHVWVAPAYGEDIRALADAIGIERVLFGSDFPHPEGLAEPLSFVDALDGFDEAEVRRVMSENLAGLLQPRGGGGGAA